MPLTFGENRGDMDETGRSRDGGTIEGALTEYNKPFRLWQKLKQHKSNSKCISLEIVFVYSDGCVL